MTSYPKQLGPAAKCPPHEVEIGPGRARHSVRIAEAVQGEQDPVRRQANHVWQVTKKSIHHCKRNPNQTELACAAVLPA